MLALFRMVEPAAGTVRLDGVDTLSLGLSDLRSNLSIIPQDPFMFSGTIRTNLDPFSRYSDADLWEALRRVGLRDVVQAMDGGLDAAVAEYGSNLSAGQQQLVALCRVLLRRSKVLMLDEATSSVDVETDAMIQRTIRSEFRDTTIISIAHRLGTIVTSDYILVLSNGAVVEYDKPAVLLRDPNSQFTHLVEEMGEAAAAKMRELAERAERGMSVEELVAAVEKLEGERERSASVATEGGAGGRRGSAAE